MIVFYFSIYLIVCVIWMISELHRLKSGKLYEEEEQILSMLSIDREQLVEELTPYAIAFCWLIFPLEIILRFLNFFEKNT